MYKIDDMTGGWFIGNFKPAAYECNGFEVGYKLHKKGEKWDIHYHKQVIEVTFLLRGQMVIQGKTLKTGDVFVIYPYEIADPKFLEDCEVIIIKTPSIPGDKFVC